MAYVQGDEVPRGSLNGFSLKKIGRTLKKAVKDTGKGIKVAAKAVAPIARIAVPIAIAGTGGIAAGIFGKRAIGGILKKRKQNVPGGVGPSADTVMVRVAKPNIGERIGTAVMSRTASTRRQVDKRTEQTREAARKARAIAKLAEGTPAAAVAERIAVQAERIAEQTQSAGNVVRQAAAGADGAVVGAGSGVAAESASQSAMEFFKSPAGLAVAGAAVVALLVVMRGRK